MPDITIGSASDIGVSRADIADFYKDNWQRRIALSQPEFLTWQFVDAPDGAGRNHCAVAHDGNQILSIMGANSRTFLDHGTPRHGAELTTWVTSEAARGKGLGRGILAHLQSRFDALAGAGISDAALSLYLAAGFVFRAHIPRYLFVTDFDAARGLAEITAQSEKLTRHRQSRGAHVPLQSEAVSAAQAAPLQTGFQSDAGFFSRDAANLAWRYDNHPVFAYQTHIVRDRAQPGGAMAVVLRGDRVNGVDILHVVDMFGDLNHAQAALCFVEDTARNTAAFVDASFTFERLSAHLRLRGWSSVTDEPFLQLPSLFYPVELRHPPTTSICFWARQNRPDLYRFGNLHFSKGDLDIDRPTLDYYDAHEISVSR